MQRIGSFIIVGLVAATMLTACSGSPNYHGGTGTADSLGGIGSVTGPLPSCAAEIVPSQYCRPATGSR